MAKSLPFLWDLFSLTTPNNSIQIVSQKYALSLSVSHSMVSIDTDINGGVLLRLRITSWASHDFDSNRHQLEAPWLIRSPLERTLWVPITHRMLIEGENYAFGMDNYISFLLLVLGEAKVRLRPRMRSTVRNEFTKSPFRWWWRRWVERTDDWILDRSHSIQ